ncbi:MAG: IS6 family transposase [Roseibium sp.]|nr:IS6 family transposase [Roseibium sp.]
MSSSAPTCKNHRYPIEIVARAIWLYFWFNLSLREVEQMLLERGIVVSYETIRRWYRKHGPDYVRRLHRKVPTMTDVWHLDEVLVSINGQKCWLWRAVDQDGYVLDEIVQTRRNTKAAKRLLTRLLKKQGLAPKRMITDKLRPYGAARRQLMPNVEHRAHKGLNNRAENSHLPFRKRERTRQGFRPIGSLQQFVSVLSAIRNHFVLPQSNRSASQIRSHRRQAMIEGKIAAEQIA